MKKSMNWLRKEESGQGIVEYGLIIILVALVAMAGLPGISTQLLALFSQVLTGLA